MSIISPPKIVSQLLSKIMKIKMCKTRTFHNTSYWCQPFYLSLREEHTRMFWNRVLRKIFGSTREK
jgi:hypothetical protein